MLHRLTIQIAAIAMLFAAVLPAPARATDNEQEAADEQPAPMFAEGHGSVSIGLQQIYSHGDYDGPAHPSSSSGNVHFDSMEFDASYFVADHWEIRAGIPYITSKYTGNYAHPQLPCPPNCEPTKIDDGSYNGFWQDWNAGVTYHQDIDGYNIAPSFDLYVPSNNYPFYGAAGIGQRTRRIGLGFELSHQLELSNFYYDAHVQYIFNQHVLNINNNYYTTALNVGYFFSPALSVRGIADVKLGNGYDDAQIGQYAPGPTATTDGANPYWELHDKFRLEEHADIGAGLDCAIASNYLLSVTVAHSVWGRANARLTYDLGLRLTRNF